MHNVAKSFLKSVAIEISLTFAWITGLATNPSLVYFLINSIFICNFRLALVELTDAELILESYELLLIPGGVDCSLQYTESLISTSLCIIEQANIPPLFSFLYSNTKVTQTTNFSNLT
jgi:hypothetical protein